MWVLFLFENPVNCFLIRYRVFVDLEMVLIPNANIKQFISFILTPTLSEREGVKIGLFYIFGWYYTLEIHTDSIQKGDRILIHDDVLATGGTAKAVCELLERLGGVIVQCNFLMEITFLNGREKIAGNEIFAAMTY